MVKYGGRVGLGEIIGCGLHYINATRWVHSGGGRCHLVHPTIVLIGFRYIIISVIGLTDYITIRKHDGYALFLSGVENNHFAQAGLLCFMKQTNPDDHLLIFSYISLGSN